MSVKHGGGGPWTHRLLIHVFSILFGLLAYWFLGFVMRDLATWPGPDYATVERALLDQQWVTESAALENQLAETTRAIASRKQRQQVLRDSTSNSEKTMNQLLELQKLTLQKGQTASAPEVKALADSQTLFLANQTKYQEINDQVAALDEQLGTLQARQREVRQQIEARQPAVFAEFSRRQARHQFKVAALKLTVLAPLLGFGAWFFVRKRGVLYAPLVHGFGLAVVAKTGQVMHEHFPTRYFKYVLITIALLLVARILVYLLRARAFPKLDWLLKQYRESYEHFLCPVCAYPIRRGPLKSLFWNRRSLKKLVVPPSAAANEDEPYTCPVCATQLFESCPSCQGTRHSLLPACSHCGAEKTVPAPGAAA